MANDALPLAAAHLSTPGAAGSLDFTPVSRTHALHVMARPSLSYWQDAWRRLRGNPRAIVSLYVVIGLLAFTLLGPLLWDVDPALQDVDQISQPPGPRGTALIVSAYSPWHAPVAAKVSSSPSPDEAAEGRTEAAPTAPIKAQLTAPHAFLVEGAPTTQAVHLTWEPVTGAVGYRVYRSLYEPKNENQLGLPIGEVTRPGVMGFEDRMDLSAQRYFYAVTSVSAARDESSAYALLKVDVQRVITPAEAVTKQIIATPEQAIIGQRLTLALHPLGTDYLGRDILARLMHGGVISLRIGIIAPLLFVAIGVLYGAIAGFLGGMVDGLMMRIADFVVALPFLLMMILIRVSFGIGGGESGIVPMLIAMVALSWPGTARLVRGQILQIREEGYVQAARLLGAPTGYLVMRHMIPNTLGVILVTLTFAVPSAIFTEAFLSFIGMGVAPPTPSWGSMCNEGRKTLLSTPHELIAPAVLISLTVLAFNLLGDGLRDALDARLRSRE